MEPPDDKTSGRTESTRGPSDPKDVPEAHPSFQHPEDHSFLIQTMLEVQRSVGKLQGTVETYHGKIDELKKEIREDIHQLREDQRNDSASVEGQLEGIRSSVDKKLDSTSFRTGLLLLGSILTALVFLPAIWKLIFWQ